MRLSVLLALVACASTQTASAQCSLQWLASEGGIPGTNGVVKSSTMWDPDGAGPLQPVLVVGGSFTIAGPVTASNIVAYDVTTKAWAPFGAGLQLASGAPSEVRALAVLPNGELVAGGTFNRSGLVTLAGIARWNGTAWSPIGALTPGMVCNTLSTLPNGDLVAGGNNVARWNGTSWSALGSGVNGSILCSTVTPGGDLVVGGEFSLAGGIPGTSRIARWNGASWSALGTGVAGANTRVAALEIWNGDVVAGGDFTTVGGVASARLAKWNGLAWSALGSASLGPVRCLRALPSGSLAIGGLASDGSQFATYSTVLGWNGANTFPLGGGTAPFTTPTANGAAHTLCSLPNGELVAGGTFTGGSLGAETPCHNIAKLDAVGFWRALGTGFDGSIKAMARLSNGDIAAAGPFTVAGTTAANGIARWNGSSWSAFGTGLDAVVNALATMPNGDLVAGGNSVFPSLGSTLARWDGTNWSGVGTGLTIIGVYSLAAMPNGDVVVGGVVNQGVISAGIVRWDGQAWAMLTAAQPGVQAQALAALPNGDLVAAGRFSDVNGVPAENIALWNGTTWSAIGAGLPGVSPGTPGWVYALHVAPNGTLFAGGSFAVGGVASTAAYWNGTTWVSLGNIGGFFVLSFATLPDGDLAIGSNTQVLRWNGSAVSTLGAATDVRAVQVGPNDELVAAGSFAAVNGIPTRFLARLASTCPATAQSTGQGCPSSGGSNTLQATTLPWVDSTFRATGTGLPTNAIVLTLTSVTSIPQGIAPLSGVFPQAGPGCDVLTAPDILGLLVTTTGTAQSEFFLPVAPPLVGVTFYHQMVPIEVGPSGAWVAVTATNALQLTGGVF